MLYSLPLRSVAILSHMAYLIPLRANDQSIRAYTVVDEVDFRRFGNKRWFLTGHHYAACSFHNGIREEQPRLHREILGLKRGDGLEADHINGNKLDNRKSNLRIVSHSQNNQNRSINCDNTSGRSEERRVGKEGRFAAITRE